MSLPIAPFRHARRAPGVTANLAAIAAFVRWHQSVG
jgi:hypothetical protein